MKTINYRLGDIDLDFLEFSNKKSLDISVVENIPLELKVTVNEKD